MLHVQLVLDDGNLANIFSSFIFIHAAKLLHLSKVLNVVLLLVRHVYPQQPESQLLVHVPGDSKMLVLK